MLVAMNHHDYLDAIRLESAALADAAGTVPLATPVPTCLDWDVAHLVTHIAQVQQWARILVETRARERIPRSALPPAPAAAELIPWFRQATSAVWTWTNERRAAYWARRQAHEVAVHRWDAQHAAGAATPIPAALAADGIDELLGMLPFVPGERAGAGETVHLHCTDTPGEWLVRLGSRGLEVERAHAQGDAAVRGPASDLELYVWGRVPADALEVLGDRALAARLPTLTAL
jgi:uncharacterized protein (TIGR03083 family)